MSTFDLVGWRTTCAIALTQILPLQTFETALVLVESYLAATGGWVPDNPSNPTGPGEPVTGETPEEAASTIKTQQYERVYHLDLEVTVKLGMSYVTNLIPGQTLNDVLIAVQTPVTNFLTAQLRSTNLRIISLDGIVGSMNVGGNTTPAMRVAIYSDLADNDTTDPRGIALETARTTYLLDDFWNVESTYTEPNGKIVVIIGKYSDLAFTTLDTEVPEKYVMTVDPTLYRIETGLFLNPIQ